MIRLIRLLVENPEVILSVLPYLPHLLGIIFTIYIAIYVKKRYKGKEVSYLMIGSILKAIAFVTSILFNLVIIPQMIDLDFTNIPYYYSAINLIGSIGSLLFLYGVYSFFKRYFANSLDSAIQENDQNSFIQRN